MRLTHGLNYIVSGLAIVLFYGYALAEGLSLDASKILAVVPVKNGNVDKNVYRHIDRIVPELRKISKNKIVKLEFSCSGQPDREQDVVNAYKLAGQIEKYLRVRHKLDLDLWVSIDITPKSVKSSPVLSIAVFSDDPKKLNAVLIDPPKKLQQ